MRLYLRVPPIVVLRRPSLEAGSSARQVDELSVTPRRTCSDEVQKPARTVHRSAIREEAPSVDWRCGRREASGNRLGLRTAAQGRRASRSVEAFGYET